MLKKATQSTLRWSLNQSLRKNKTKRQRSLSEYGEQRGWRAWSIWRWAKQTLGLLLMEQRQWDRVVQEAFPPPTVLQMKTKRKTMQDTSRIASPHALQTLGVTPPQHNPAFPPSNKSSEKRLGLCVTVIGQIQCNCTTRKINYVFAVLNYCTIALVSV